MQKLVEQVSNCETGEQLVVGDSETPTRGRLRIGDCVDVLRSIPDDSIDLAYLDPPYNTGRKFHSRGEDGETKVAYDDTHKWTDGTERMYEELVSGQIIPGPAADAVAMLKMSVKTSGRTSSTAYLTGLMPVIVEVHRTLKATGMIALQCSPRESNCLDLTLRTLFGHQRCLGRIAWQRSGPKNNARHGCGNVHDTIFMFAKSDAYTWNGDEVREPLSGRERKFFDVVDPDGRKWQPLPLVAPGQAGDESSFPWRGIDPAPLCWCIPDLIVRDREAASGTTLRGNTILDTLNNLAGAGLIDLPENGNSPLYKLYLDQTVGVPVRDVWMDVWASRRNGRVQFETQKPEVLLERILYLLSNPGDMVLDPFLGSGTTAVVAERMGRKWLGIERNPDTAKLAAQRISDARNDTSAATSKARRRGGKKRFWGGLIQAPTTR